VDPSTTRRTIKKRAKLLYGLISRLMAELKDEDEPVGDDIGFLEWLEED
jgi:hypothetical protein